MMKIIFNNAVFQQRKTIFTFYLIFYTKQKHIRNSLKKIDIKLDPDPFRNRKLWAIFKYLKSSK